MAQQGTPVPYRAYSGVVPDFNDQDQVVGIEIRGVKERVPLADLRQMQFEVA
jgi:hypothetical protein